MRFFSTDRDNDGEQPWYKRPTVVRAASVALALVLIFVGWLAFHGLSAKSNLEKARDNAQQAKDALLGGETAEASQFAGEAQSHAQAARNAAHSLPWNIASAIPVLGRPFKTGQQMSDVVLGLTADVLKPTADAGVDVAPKRMFANGQLNVDALGKQEKVLSKIAADAARLNTDAQAIANPHFPLLSGARSQLQAQTSDIAKLMGNTALAAKLAPSMMGADGPRSYFVGFQTDAEARGTGGLLGGFGILRFDNGKPKVETLGPNTTLMEGPFTPFSVNPEFDEQYGFTNPTTDIRNSNQSSHFPYAAQIWKSMWAQQSGMNVDGAIAIDPVALSYILGAVGPVVMPDGETVTENSVIELTESEVYRRFPTDQAARKRYLQTIATEVVKKLAKPLESPRKLLDALGRAVSERRIAVWSSHPADQKLLEGTSLAHAIPDDPAPYAGVVINNLGGNKIDYYLTRQIEYAADGCRGDTRRSTVTVKLTNNVEDGNALPEYVGGRLGFFPEIKADIPKGTMITSVRLLATGNAKLTSAIIDGTRTPVFQSLERGHPSFEVHLAIPAGKTAEVVFQLSEPTVAGAPRVPVQPLIDNPEPVISVPTC